MFLCLILSRISLNLSSFLNSFLFLLSVWVLSITLFSRSLICSSAFANLLVDSLYCVFYFSCGIFQLCFFFMFSISFFMISLSSSIIFSSLVSIFMIISLIFYKAYYLSLFNLVLFLRFYLGLCFGAYSFVSPFA